MTYVPGINQAYTATDTTEKTTESKRDTLGQQDFLTLLVAQLQNQDPLNPSDPTEFTSQLANYSQLEQLFNLNDSMNKLAESQENSERLSALSMIGKEVLVQGSTFTLEEGPVEIGYKVDGPADEIIIHIQDSAGQRVATLHPTDLTPGNHFITWQGLSEEGEALAPGTYTLVIEASSIEGETVAVSPLVRTPVTGVDLGDNGALLLTDAGEYGLNEIYGVYENSVASSQSEEDGESTDATEEDQSSQAMDGSEAMEESEAPAS